MIKSSFIKSVIFVLILSIIYIIGINFLAVLLSVNSVGNGQNGSNLENGGFNINFGISASSKVTVRNNIRFMGIWVGIAQGDSENRLFNLFDKVSIPVSSNGVSFKFSHYLFIFSMVAIIIISIYRDIKLRNERGERYK